MLEVITCFGDQPAAVQLIEALCSNRGWAKRICQHWRKLLLRIRMLHHLFPGHCLLLLPVRTSAMEQ